MDAFVFDESENSGAGGKIPLILISSKFLFLFSFICIRFFVSVVFRLFEIVHLPNFVLIA